MQQQQIYDNKHPHNQQQQQQQQLQLQQPRQQRCYTKAPPAVLFCSICQDLFRSPVFLPRCGHHFCRDCIAQWQSSNTPSSQDCPTCRTSIYITRTSPQSPPSIEKLCSAFIVVSLIAELDVCCPNGVVLLPNVTLHSGFGYLGEHFCKVTGSCEVVMSDEAMKQHVLSCPFSATTCECGAKCSKAEMKTHKASASCIKYHELKKKLEECQKQIAIQQGKVIKPHLNTIQENQDKIASKSSVGKKLSEINIPQENYTRDRVPELTQLLLHHMDDNSTLQLRKIFKNVAEIHLDWAKNYSDNPTNLTLNLRMLLATVLAFPGFSAKEREHCNKWFMEVVRNER